QTPVANDLYELTFPAEPDGDIVKRDTGRVVARYTNDETGKSIEVNVSGPGTKVIHPDGTETDTTAGTWGLLGSTLFPASFPGPPLAFFIMRGGRAMKKPSPSDFETAVSFTGTVKLDICAALS